MEQRATQPLQSAKDLIHELGRRSSYGNLSTSRQAFETLTEILRESLTFLYTAAALHPMSLTALRKRLPEDDAWAKYEAGEHVGAWAGIELARLYRQMQADLRSRSKHSGNRLRRIRCGFGIGNFVVPRNRWFCEEYASKVDYRPTGEMAIWIARKIQELRRIKQNRSQRLNYTRIKIADHKLRLREESEIYNDFPEVFRSDLVEGEALTRLDNLPVFGSSGAEDFEEWRMFVRRRLLTPKLVTEFDRLFPNNRRKLDGVVESTLLCAWRAVRRGGNVFFS